MCTLFINANSLVRRVHCLHLYESLELQPLVGSQTYMVSRFFWNNFWCFPLKHTKGPGTCFKVKPGYNCSELGVSFGLSPATFNRVELAMEFGQKSEWVEILALISSRFMPGWYCPLSFNAWMRDPLPHQCWKPSSGLYHPRQCHVEGLVFHQVLHFDCSLGYLHFTIGAQSFNCSKNRSDVQYLSRFSPYSMDLLAYCFNWGNFSCPATNSSSISSIIHLVQQISWCLHPCSSEQAYSAPLSHLPGKLFHH